VEALISPDPLPKEFLAHGAWVRTLYQAVKPDPVAIGLAVRVGTLTVIAAAIRERAGEAAAHISGVIVSSTSPSKWTAFASPTAAVAHDD